MSDASREMQRSSRDLGELRDRLESWLATRLPRGAEPTVADLGATTANGMSSETILFTASWTQDGANRTEDLVARIAPDARDVPVFPRYDLDLQFRTIQRVGELSDVPVPAMYWSEPDPAAIGSSFFVMQRVTGDVPPDVMPYNFGDSWLFHATPDEQRRLQDSSVAVLVGLHAIAGAERELGFLAYDEPGDSALRRHIAHARAWYDFAARDCPRSALVEAGFAWLDDHWPADVGPTCLSWGDARIGNTMYRDFQPVAVLDWEMAGLGPPELDLAWMVYAHRVFEDIAGTYGFPGMPHFLRRDDVATAYEALAGYAPRDLDFYTLYAAVLWGIVGMRTATRQAHFGERELPDDGDELVLNRPGLERQLAGEYWSALG